MQDVVRREKRKAVLDIRARIDEKKKSYDHRQNNKFRVRMLLKQIGGRGCRGGYGKQRWIFKKLAAMPPSRGETDTPRNTPFLRMQRLAPNRIPHSVRIANMRKARVRGLRSKKRNEARRER